MTVKEQRKTGAVVVVLLILWVAYICYALLKAPGSAFGTVLRGTGLLGYTALFLSIISSEYRREMRAWFGRPFMNIHHVLSVVGLFLVTLHPLSYALRLSSLSVLVPVWSPLRSFLLWAGRPALYLVWIAVGAAVVRGRLKTSWRYLHWLNYLAFAMVFAHAWLIGSDLASGPLRIAWLLMAAVVLLVFVRKRVLRR